MDYYGYEVYISTTAIYKTQNLYDIGYLKKISTYQYPKNIKEESSDRIFIFKAGCPNPADICYYVKEKYKHYIGPDGFYFLAYNKLEEVKEDIEKLLCEQMSAAFVKEKISKDIRYEPDKLSFMCSFLGITNKSKKISFVPDELYICVAYKKFIFTLWENIMVLYNMIKLSGNIEGSNDFLIFSDLIDKCNEVETHNSIEERYRKNCYNKNVERLLAKYRYMGYDKREKELNFEVIRDEMYPENKKIYEAIVEKYGGLKRIREIIESLSPKTRVIFLTSRFIPLYTFRKKDEYLKFCEPLLHKVPNDQPLKTMVDFIYDMNCPNGKDETTFRKLDRMCIDYDIEHYLCPDL